MSITKKIEFFLLLLILVGGIVVKLYRFNGPIADWHSWRQSDTSAVSRNFVTYGFDLLHPQYDDISNVQTGVDNPHGYRFVEFPIYNLAQAGFFKLFGKFTLEEWGRIVSILVSTFATLFIYLLTTKHANSRAGLFAGFFYAFVPYDIYYGRTILPDPSMTMAILGGIYFFDRWVDIYGQKKSKSYVFYLLSVLFTAVSFLLKPYALFFVLPMIWITWQKWGKRMFLQPSLWLFLFLTSTPLVAWRIWMLQYPEGVPSSGWLFNGGNIRFTGAFFYWIFRKRISGLILNGWGLTIVLLGLLNIKKDKGFFLSAILSSLVYLIVIARGNVQHDYYQILIIPSLAFLYGLGADFLCYKKKLFSWITALLILFICTIFMLAFDWYQVRDYFNINNPSLVVAGKAVDALTPPHTKIVAPYDGDTTLLYQTNRKGWPSFEKSLEELIPLGADYLVLVNPKQQDYAIGKTYKIVSATNDYILFSLRQKP